MDAAGGVRPTHQPWQGRIGDRLRPCRSGTTHTVFRGGSGEPLVLIHGFSGTRHLWDPILAELERSFDVLAVNLAGHVGGPEFGAAPVSVSALVDAVAARPRRSRLWHRAPGRQLARRLDCARAGDPRPGTVGGRVVAGRRLGAGNARRATAAGSFHPAQQDVEGHLAEGRHAHAPAPSAPPGAAGGRRPRRAHPADRRRPDDPRLGRLPGLLRADGRNHARRAASVRSTALRAPCCSRGARAIGSSRSSATRSGCGRCSPTAEWVTLPGAGHVPISDEPELVVRSITEFVGRVREPVAAVS